MRKLYVVGIGPGDPDYMTAEADKALSSSEFICGYTAYAALIRARYPEKEFYTTGMTEELLRCRRALEEAESGRTAALISSGDAGVYGMAGPVLEMLPEFPDVTVTVISGVTAALSGAAVLGAPLGHDFCVISLSDRLTPFSVIERRLRCAAEGDFSICLYNPASKARTESLRRACEILLETKSPDTVCGWVRKIGRSGQEHRILSLQKLRDEVLDMETTVFVGAGSTKLLCGRIVTPRGYRALP